MTFEDLLFIIRWWALILILGAAFLPFTISLFKNFFDKGYIFSKVLGIVILSYGVFILGLSHIAPFTFLTIVFVILASFGFNLYYFRKNFLEIVKSKWKIFLLEELLFFAGIVFWANIRAHSPDIHGLEKFMDFGFLNSILRTDYFPPKDMWFTPLPINYYYFGHLITAVLTKLSFIPSSITYNLMLATLFAFTFVCSFSIGANLIYLSIKDSIKEKIPNFSKSLIIIISGLLTGFLVSLSGNLQTIYAFFKPYENENPVPFWTLVFSPNTFPNSYWYPNATRFIANTIHEFPIYSFVVSDLHGHVLDIPIVLLIIAVFLNIFKKIGDIKLWMLIFISFLLSVMYMTNAWDGIIYFFLAMLIFFCFYIYYLFFGHTKKISLSKILKYLVTLSVGFFIFSIPFSLNFKPFASGIGLLCAPEFLTNIEKFGPLLFEKDHCARSPIWQLLILHGFFYFWAISFIALIRKKIKIVNSYVQIKNISVSNGFVLILIILSTILVIVPEFIYLKDIYPAHYRANTMFKLTYQAFMMLSIVSSYVIIRFMLSFRNNIKKNKLFVLYYIVGFFILSLVSLYPFFSVESYYGSLKTNSGLDGTKYLSTLLPSDYEAINWINKNIKGQPVILEAQGDSYTDFARISSNTGLATVLGWTVHEWLWRGSYDVPSPRIGEIETLYNTQDNSIAKNYIDKYKISYIYIGAMEIEKYPDLSEDKFKNLGKLIYQNNETKIYRIN